MAYNSDSGAPGGFSFPTANNNSGYNPSYAPSYAPPPNGPPPGGYAPPSGGPPSMNFPGGPGAPYTPPTGGYGGPPPPNYGQGYAPPPGGPPPSHYTPPPGGPPPSHYTPPASQYPPPSGGPPSHYTPPPPGPPPSGQYNYNAPPGPPPPNSHAPPPGPPRGNSGGGFPGAQYHQQHSGQQNNAFPNQNQGYRAPGGPPPGAHHPPPPRPPTGQQNYGPHYQGADHRDHQPYFKYSQCNGKKKALCIGINYKGQNGELRGCINDARNIQRFLIQQYGYKEQDIVMLTDDATNPRQRPTGQNIRDGMRWLVKGAAPNDSLFFHYSGHGGQTKDLDGDEADGNDEVIYPLDHERNGHIVDDEMHAIMVKPLPAGCRLTAIFDSCHSGSSLDLPYIYSTEGKVKEPNLAAEAGQGLLSAVTSYARGDMGGVFKSAMGLVKTATGSNAKADAHAKATKTSPADCISWSGCKDTQTSADTQEQGNATGAMSFAFISAIRQNPQQSFQELLVSIREILRSKYSQKPQLSSSHPMDTNLMFIC